jgi:SPP1 gp7 family putative phage head morphogenesis protein
LHGRIDNLYSCTCGTCNHQSQDLDLALNPKFKKLLNSVEKAFKKLHKKGGYKPKDLKTEIEYQTIIQETTEVLSRAFQDNDLSEGMLKSLQKDTFLFSSLKVHSQLFEASRLLLTEEKKIKPFARFQRDVSKIKKDYNENYLEAEYDFAVGSGLTAQRWESFKDGDRYLLQYRTAKDSRVRKTHKELHDITLPKTDSFWDKYFPPNGWRCRCTVAQVLARLSKKSNSKKANSSGAAATTQIGKSGKNKLEIFRFNPGKSKVVFPPNHPYHKVKGAASIKKSLRNE